MGLLGKLFSRSSRHPVIVYQMGNVGSSTIHTSLQRIGIDSHHVHHLNLETIRTFREAYRQRAQSRAERILDEIIPRAERVRYITIMRDPVAGAVSGSFHRVLSDEEDNDQPTIAGEPTQEAIEEGFEQRVRDRLAYRLNWFDQELKTVVGVDVLKHPFPQETGHQIIHADNGDILLLTIETEDTVMAEAIAAFLGVDTLTLVPANTGDARPFAELYAEFKKRISLPADMLDWAYEAPIVQHFYSEAQRQSFRQRWS